MSYLGILPISLVLLAFATFAVSYIIAVVRRDVVPAFPYISDTGSKQPESCIFGQLLNSVAFLAFLTMYVRYKAVEAISHTTLTDNLRLYRLNKGSLILGLLSAFGTSVVANFQEGTVVEPVHITGAVLTFIAGILYCFLQTALSYHMCPEYNGLYICRVRLSISLMSLTSLIITIIAGVVAICKWSSRSQSMSRFNWSPDDPGYPEHLVSTVGEWVTALTFLIFFFTYVREFNKFEMEIRTRPLVQHLDQVPNQRPWMEVNERSHLLI